MKELVPLFERVRAGEAVIVVSVITEAELLVRPLRSGDMRAVERIRDLLSEDEIEVLDVDRVIARKAAELRVENHLALADSLIVATGIEGRCQAIIGNDAAWAKRPLEVPYVLLDRASGRNEVQAGSATRAEA